MLHPLIQTLATRPDLLAEHVAGYGELIAAEAGDLATRLRTRALLGVVLGACVVLTVAFGGAALLLVAAVPLQAMPYPQLLAAVPALPACVALVCWWQLHQAPADWSMETLRAQMAADAALLREAGAA